MWKLTSKTGKVHYLLSEKEKHVVGRSSADLILKDDTSISRTHAYLFPSANHVKLIDAGSKYGTFYNENIDHNISMDKNIPVELKNGERIRFGLLQNEWILSKMKLTTLTSTLNTDQKMQLKGVLKLLNGEIIESYAPNCTHLTMRGITVTPKLLYALVERIPIVNCQYWRDYLIELRIGNSPPNPENYLPEIAEEFLKFSKHLLKPNEARKALFAGKTFVFISKKQYDTYLAIIPQAGGQIKTLNKGVEKAFLTQKNVIVIQYMPTTESQSSQTIDSIAEYLKTKSLRMVPDYEIGLALVNCSIEKYCNPKFNVILDVCSPTKNTQKDQLEVIVAETPVNQQTNTGNICEEVPESNIYEAKNESENSIQLIENSYELGVDSNEFNIEMKESYCVDKNIGENLLHVEKNIAENLENESCNTLPNTIPFNNQKENKRKHDYINEGNENFKRVCPNKEKEIPKSRTEKTVSLNLDRFMNSSQIIKTTRKEDDTESNKPTENENSKAQKRGRFAAIASDDDDDDLFDFGKSLKKSKHDNRDSAQNTAKIDNVHNQKKNQVENFDTIRNNPAKPVSGSTRITKLTKPHEPIERNVKKSIKIIPGEWLSKSLIKLEIKDNEKSVNETTDTFNNNDSIQSDWINSIKSGFEVRAKQMNLTVQTRENISLEENNDTSLQSDNKSKNFKAFVKKINYIPQKEILTTVPFQIHGFSF